MNSRETKELERGWGLGVGGVIVLFLRMWLYGSTLNSGLR